MFISLYLLLIIIIMKFYIYFSHQIHDYYMEYHYLDDVVFDNDDRTTDTTTNYSEIFDYSDYYNEDSSDSETFTKYH